MGSVRILSPGRNTSTHPICHVSEHIHQFCRAWQIVTLCPAVRRVLKCVIQERVRSRCYL